MTLLVYFVFIYRRTKFVGQFIFLNTPIIKRLVQEVEISKFGYILGNYAPWALPREREIDSDFILPVKI